MTILARCDNCGNTEPLSQLRDIKDYCQRVEPFGEEPDGECSKCGALSYVINEASDPYDAQSQGNFQ